MKFLCLCVVLLAFFGVQCKVAIYIDTLNEIHNNTNTGDKHNSETSKRAIIDVALNEIDHKKDDSENEIEPKSLTFIPVKNCTVKIKLFKELVVPVPSECNTKVIDTGTALILTKFLEEGNVVEARSKSRVDPNHFMGIESYSGYFTVNKTYNSNLFFWYFPVFNRPVNETPWIIWLQGGPGASSLTGLFDEIGPFRVLNDSLRANPYTWLKNHSIIFIDNPVGTGFSFTDSPDGYAQDMETYSAHLYSTVSQFLQVFPELRTAPLYIAGESYAGKYVPALGMEIHKHKLDGDLEINFQGLMVGNAFIDPEVIKDLSIPMMYFGLLQKQQIELIRPLLDSFKKDVEENNSLAAKEKWGNLIVVLLFLTHQNHNYNYLRDDLYLGRFQTFLTKPEIKKAIHVGDIHYDMINVTVNYKMAPDFLRASKPIFEKLLENYRVLTYCGQLDLMLPCVYSSQNNVKWSWSQADKFRTAIRYPYMLNGRLAGYYRSGGNLTEVVVRGAGHMVPMDAPAMARDMVSKFTHGINYHTYYTYYGAYFSNLLKNMISPSVSSNITTYFNPKSAILYS